MLSRGPKSEQLLVNLANDSSRGFEERACERVYDFGSVVRASNWFAAICQLHQLNAGPKPPHNAMSHKVVQATIKTPASFAF